MLKWKKKQQTFIILLCFIFLSYLILTPAMNELGRTTEYSTVRSNELKPEPTSMTPVSKLSLITSFYNLNDILIEGNASLAQYTKMAQDRQLIFKGLYIVALLLAGYCVLLSYRRCFKKPTDRHIPLMSISLGGHAPPTII